MASFNYMNNTAPFWDFVANLERQGNNHPIFGQDHHNRSTENEHSENPWGPPHPANPWSWGPQLFGGPGGLPHRGPPGPPPPPGPHGPPPHHHDEGHMDHEKNDHDMGNDDDKGKEKDNDNDNGEGPSGSGSDSEGGRHRGRHGRCGGRRGRHGFGGRGGSGGRGGFGSHHHGPHHHGPRGGHHGPPHHGGGPWGPHHRSHPYGGRGSDSEPSGPFDPLSFLNPLLAAFTAQHPSNNPTSTTNAPKHPSNSNEDFVPDADIFDTPSSYLIHLSLPGARKEDVGVNWDADKSELSIAGVIYRPSVDEELLKSLAVSERNVGPFERKIRLGSRANPARVDAEGISAKLEDGVLRVEVPKEGDAGFVEVRKVDVE